MPQSLKIDKVLLLVAWQDRCLGEELEESSHKEFQTGNRPSLDTVSTNSLLFSNDTAHSHILGNRRQQGFGKPIS